MDELIIFLFLVILTFIVIQLKIIQLEKRIEKLENKKPLTDNDIKVTANLGEYIILCGKCGLTKHLVRPGKYQCPRCE